MKNTYELITAICEGLIAKYDVNDPDYKIAKKYNILENIIDLFASCYDAESFLDWLDRHDLDILVDLRYADIKTYEEVINELNKGNECDLYNIDFEEWEKLETEEEKIEYIKDHFDGLFYNDYCLVFYW